MDGEKVVEACGEVRPVSAPSAFILCACQPLFPSVCRLLGDVLQNR